MKNYLTKQILALFLVLLCAVAFFSCKKGKPSELDSALNRTIRIGYDGVLCMAAVPVAQHKGFFAEQGITAELLRTGGDVRDAIIGRKLDFTTGMVVGWLKPMTNGVDVRFTMGLHTGCSSALVLADSSITKFEKGQTVAITGGYGGTFQQVTYRFISNDGFVPEDFIWKDFPGDQLLLVLQNKQADVAVIHDQLGEQWVISGQLKKIRTQSDEDFVDDVCCMTLMGGWFVDENPTASKKISQAVYNASKWIDKNDENKYETAKILIENGYISGSIEYAYELLKMWRFGLSNKLSEETIIHNVKQYQALGVIDKTLDPEDFKKQSWAPLVDDWE